MGFFTFNESAAIDVLPVGFYETFITEVKPATFNSGSKGLKMVVTVRTDVDQVGGKQKLTENLVMSESAAFKIHQLLKAVGTPDGADFATESDFIKAIINRPLRIKVVHELYEGDNKARIKAFYASEVGGEHVDSFEQPGLGAPLDIKEEDLPF